MHLVRNGIYGLVLLALWPWLVFRAVAQGKNRRGWCQKLFGWVPRRTAAGPCVWLHAVSVGEIVVAAKLVQALRERHGNLQVVVSTTTETGFDLARSRLPETIVFFWPLDFSWAVRNAIRRIQPDMVVLTELELWPNMVQACRADQLPVVVVNGRMGERSYRGYCRWRWLTGNMFQHLTCAMVQTNEYRNRLIELGTPPERVAQVGNIKFDGVEFDRINPRTEALRQIIGATDQLDIWMAGSTQEEEDQMAVNVWRRARCEHPELRLVLVPRHLNRVSRLVDWIRSQYLDVVCWSDEDPGAMSRWRAGQAVLIVDKIGLLSDLWGLARIAYVGGSMGRRGGQNMIEPAGFGIPVSFGPCVWNFQEVVDELLQHQAATMVHDEAELERFVRWAITNRDEALKMGVRAQRWVAKQQGALASTVDLLCEHLPLPSAPTQASNAA